jgi:two-component system sensor histidine kinase KdpD
MTESAVRADPDALLKRVNESEARSRRAKLKIFFGFAPGVGKTFAMLEAARRLRADGADLVVGCVETHGRPETEALLGGLPILPRREIEHRRVVLREFDLEGALARKPTILLLDELAHTNAPGSARPKRWEDVEVIRDAGIHVVTTMNVQHLESVSDAVATITGAPVNERLPDEILLIADEIELVDMSPHALRQRMKHGNVYPPERTQVALDKFFTESNLTALRELSLRLVARRVEDQLEDTIAGQQLPLVTDRVVVLVDGSPASLRAVRRAAMLAGALHAGFVAVLVETPAVERQPFDRQRDIQEALDDAVDLGAEVVRVESPDVVTGLEQVARSSRATHLVLPHVERSGLTRLRERPIVDRLIERLPEVELHVVGPGERHS